MIPEVNEHEELDLTEFWIPQNGHTEAIVIKPFEWAPEDDNKENLVIQETTLYVEQ